MSILLLVGVCVACIGLGWVLGWAAGMWKGVGIGEQRGRKQMYEWMTSGKHANEQWADTAKMLKEVNS